MEVGGGQHPQHSHPWGSATPPNVSSSDGIPIAGRVPQRIVAGFGNIGKSQKNASAGGEGENCQLRNHEKSPSSVFVLRSISRSNSFASTTGTYEEPSAMNVGVVGSVGSGYGGGVGGGGGSAGGGGGGGGGMASGSGSGASLDQLDRDQLSPMKHPKVGKYV